MRIGFGRVIVVVIIVVVHTKIARSQDLSVLASGQCCQDVKNNKKSDELSLLSTYKHYRSYIIFD